LVVFGTGRKKGSMIFLTQLPFLIELFGDWQLIKNGKPDIHWGTRLIMILLVSIDYTQLSWGQIVVIPSQFVACLILYPFFDNFLNKLMGWDWRYLGNTKGWDMRLKKLHPQAVDALRIAFTVGFILGWYLLK
jgi:hypothetical protein